MDQEKLLCWNVHGLNSRARRSVVRTVVMSEHLLLLCLQETKVQNFPVAWIVDIMGTNFDYACLPAIDTAGEGAGSVLLARRHDVWSDTMAVTRAYSVSVHLARLNGSTPGWWLTSVYGPTVLAEKATFLDELRGTMTSCPGPALYCSDFNMIYQDQDKNQGRPHRSWMRRFRRVIDDLQLADIHLHGRLYTWSSERRRPTLERLDRMLATCAWLDLFPNHYLACMSSDCSDHAPLSLRLDVVPWAKPQFCFEAFWTTLDGFLDVVAEAWSAMPGGADACRTLDSKLRYTAKALRAWSAKSVDGVRLQLTMARLIVKELDVA
jgi:exonuclease III